jgi:C-terminal processing protease CtpA/Prc
MRPGDQILEVRQPDGTSQSLYGMPLESAVKLIRGEPGSDLELRILRRNDSSGQLEEHVVPVKRAQLYLNDRAAPKQY